MPSRRTPSSPIRLWMFRLAAVALGLSVLGIAEGVCRLTGWGAADDADDPYVTFAGTRPLFVLNEKTDRYEIAANRLNYFSPESFSRVKDAQAYRIFVLGESTVAGEPYNSRTSFTTWLELHLRAADARRDWDVVNCGGISYASYRLVPILQECLAYQPDLLVLCIGHNEFLEDRTYAGVKNVSPWISGLHANASHSQLYRAMKSGWQIVRGDSAGRSPARDVLPTEVSARLDFQGGLAAYHRDDEWRSAVVAHYGANLRRMASLARQAGIPVVLVRQPTNLCDCPPFKSEHRADLTQRDQVRFDDLVHRAESLLATDLPKAVAVLREAISLDDRYALTHYQLGKALQDLQRTDEARAACLAAREEDVCPLRMPAAIERELAAVSREADVPLLDLHALLESRDPGGILGNFGLVDHVHPSIPSHQAIADELAGFLESQRIAQRRPDWPALRDAAYGRHFASLGDMYFLKGERTLQALRGWAQGRADRRQEDAHAD